MLTHCRSAQLTKQVLLQDTMRLSGAAYTVGDDGRGGPFFVCRGRCPHRPVGGHMGPPLRKRIFFRGAFPRGNSIKGAEAPFWSFQGDRVLRERWKFEIPLSLSGSLVTFCPHRKSLAAAAAKSLFCFRGYSACGRATFQRRKVAKVLRACGPGPRRVALFRWHSRSARCPHEGCQKIIAAALPYRQTTCFYKMICA